MKSLRVKPIMMTGDNVYVAKAIAKSVGIDGDVVSLKSFSKDMLRDGIGSIGVLAEAYPEDKHSIVESLQSRGHVVGMTSDGVNDAPALRKLSRCCWVLLYIMHQIYQSPQLP